MNFFSTDDGGTKGSGSGIGHHASTTDGERFSDFNTIEYTGRQGDNVTFLSIVVCVYQCVGAIKGSKCVTMIQHGDGGLCLS